MYDTCSHVDVVGDHHFRGDIVYNLQEHSLSSKPTYAYYFTERVSIDPKLKIFHRPEWAKTSADHAEDLFYVFGASFLKSEEPTMWQGRYLFLQELVAYLLHGGLSKSSD